MADVVDLDKRRPKKRGQGARKTKPASPPEPWERQADETRPAFEAFAMYRDMGSDRTLRRVAKQTRKSEGLIERWSRERGWQRRVTLYDDMVDRRRSESAIQAIEQMSDRQARDLATIADSLAEPARELARRFIRNPRLIADMSFEDLVKVTLATGRVYPGLVQAERLVRGLSTDRPEHDGRIASDSEAIRYLTGLDDGAAEVVARVGVVVNGHGAERPALPEGES
jgi:hypothetical protein